MASPDSSPTKLSKEVLPPQKPSSGVGVMLVAAAAMFFAVASSALILRTRMAGECCPAGAAHATPVIVDVEVPAEPPAEPECGKAVYQRLLDGTISVTYRACPEAEAPAVAPGPEPPPAPPVRGIEVGRIQAASSASSATQ
jgi:hypothetical protein